MVEENVPCILSKFPFLWEIKSNSYTHILISAFEEERMLGSLADVIKKESGNTTNRVNHKEYKRKKQS